MADTVTVASRLPMTLRMSVQGHTTAVINGTDHREVLDGAGITEDVSKALFDAWMQAHGKSAVVTQGMISMVDIEDAAKADAAAPPPAQPAAAAAPVPTGRGDLAEIKGAEIREVAPIGPPAALPV